MRKWMISVLFIAMPCITFAAEPSSHSKKDIDAKFNQLFKDVDTNENGTISWEEAMLKAPAMVENFDAIDTNHDRELSKAELRAFTAAIEKKRFEFAKQLEAADQDKNGKLSREEVKGLPNLAAHFDEIDSNHDGQLVIKEIADYVRNRSTAPAGNTSPASAPTAQ
jgi:Ca2+-binding EF-hand superfamily protein